MNRFLAASILGLLLLAILATGVYFYQRYSIILVDPVRGVPADAALILEIKNPGESLRSFFTGALRKSLEDDPWMRQTEKNFSLFDSLLQEDGDVAEIWEDHSLVISSHLIKAGSFDFLYLTNLPRGWTEQKLRMFIEKAGMMTDKFRRREYENVNIYESQLNDSTIFTFASSKSVAIFSVSPLLVELAIRQLKAGSSLTQSKAFLKVVPPASGSASIRVYFNNQSLKEIATSISADPNNNFFRHASMFARWNGFTAEAGKEHLTMKGSTVPFDTTSYLSFLRNQKAQALNAADISPSRTALLYEFAISSFPDYYNHLRFNSGFSLSEEEQQKLLGDLKEKFQAPAEAAFTSWIAGEMALVITEPAGSSFDNNVYACVKTRNPSEAINQLHAFRDVVAKQGGMIPVQEKYRDHTISTINIKGIIPVLYGKIFSGLTGCSYTAVKDYIVFSNQHASLKSFIDEIEESKTLSKDPLFQQAVENMEGSGNARLYVSPQRSFNLYRPANLHSFLSTLYNSSGIHAQWTNQGDSWNAELVFDFHKKTMKEPVLFWALQLDTVLSSVPVTIKESDGRTFVYVQDAKNTLYKLDESGSVIWQLNLQTKILSEIFPVDIYRDGRRQLLFNTASQLILMDTEGNPAGHYPIRLPAAATNGCIVVPTAYSFNTYVACSNHYMYAYEGGGKPMPDWNYIRTGQIIRKPVQAFTVGQNTWLVVRGDSGNVMVTDRKGNRRTSYADKFTQAPESKCYLWETDSAGNVQWITTDTEGNAVYFTQDGIFERKQTAGFSPNHVFIYPEATVTQEPALFYFDNSTFYHLDAEGETVAEQPMPGYSLMHAAINLPDGSRGVLISSADKDLFAILNSKGEMEKGFPLKGSVNPVLTELKRAVIICGNRDGMLYCYKTE